MVLLPTGNPANPRKCCTRGKVCVIKCPDKPDQITQIVIELTYPGGTGIGTIAEDDPFPGDPAPPPTEYLITCPGSDEDETIVVDVDEWEAGQPAGSLVGCEFRIRREVGSSATCDQSGVLYPIGGAAEELYQSVALSLAVAALDNLPVRQLVVTEVSTWRPNTRYPSVDDKGYQVTKTRTNVLHTEEKPELEASTAGTDGFDLVLEVDTALEPPAPFEDRNYYRVSAVRIINPGWAYTQTPVLVSPKNGAIELPGSVVSITANTTNYNINTRLVVTAGGAGTGATLQTNRRLEDPWQFVSGIRINAAGTGYAVGDPVTVTNVTPAFIFESAPASGRVAEVGPNGEIVRVEILSEGKYTGRRVTSITLRQGGKFMKYVPNPKPEDCRNLDLWTLSEEVTSGAPVDSGAAPVEVGDQYAGLLANCAAHERGRSFRVCELAEVKVSIQ